MPQISEPVRDLPDSDYEELPVLALEFDVEAARAELERRGFVVLKRESYRRAQERQRVAEARRQAEVERREATERWAERAFEEQRRLADRLTFVYGVARAHGASIEELDDA